LGKRFALKKGAQASSLNLEKIQKNLSRSINAYSIKGCRYVSIARKDNKKWILKRSK
jgi:hypothetical protein